jgi:hypothetical protein
VHGTKLLQDDDIMGSFNAAEQQAKRTTAWMWKTRLRQKCL